LVTTYQTVYCLKTENHYFFIAVVTSRLILKYPAGLTDLYYVSVIQANFIDFRVNLIIETLCVLHTTTHKANKVNPAWTMKSGGFM
jgi:hypothetical protein